jgi:hypothetical protein
LGTGPLPLLVFYTAMTSQQYRRLTFKGLFIAQLYGILGVVKIGLTSLQSFWPIKILDKHFAAYCSLVLPAKMPDISQSGYR